MSMFENIITELTPKFYLILISPYIQTGSCLLSLKRLSGPPDLLTYFHVWSTILASDGIEFINDGKNIIGIEYGSNRFFYRRDLLGNVIALLDSSGNIVVKYTYSGFATGIGTAFGVFGTINNIVNSVYYNFISDGHSELTPTSYHDGYINRWERLDLTKQETGDVWYNLNALRYYGEYNTHMYGWFFTGWAHEKEIFLFSGIAESAYEADVDGQIWESGENWWRNIIYLIAGFLGI